MMPERRVIADSRLVPFVQDLGRSRRENELMSQNAPAVRTAIHLLPGDGRSYSMGRIRSVFKADAEETEKRYSISEWWLEPNTTGPGAHSHEADDVFYVIEGAMSFLVGDHWIDAPQGSFVLVPGGITHDFENRSTARAGVLNLSIPGEFESHMPAIVKWFDEHPPGDASN
jgi:mannose-6-phosphate isomerase-like protein (cupin superfamily)